MGTRRETPWAGVKQKVGHRLLPAPPPAEVVLGDVLQTQRPQCVPVLRQMQPGPWPSSHMLWSHRGTPGPHLPFVGEPWLLSGTLLSSP